MTDAGICLHATSRACWSVIQTPVDMTHEQATVRLHVFVRAREGGGRMEGGGVRRVEGGGLCLRGSDRLLGIHASAPRVRSAMAWCR